MSRQQPARLQAGIVLCLVWANFFLGYFLMPRVADATTQAPGAGEAPSGEFYVIDRLGRPQPVREAAYLTLYWYELGSFWLPWIITPLVLLCLALFGRKSVPGQGRPNPPGQSPPQSSSQSAKGPL